MAHNSTALFSRTYQNPVTFDRYTANGIRAALDALFDRGRFGKPDGSGGVEAVSFDELFTYTSGDTPRVTMNADGVFVWSCHNYVSSPSAPATQTITGLLDGSKVTVTMTGSGSITLSGGGTGTVSEGADVEVTLSSTNLTLTVAGEVLTMQAHRSDLGGMAENPFAGGKFCDGFLPRVGHHGMAAVPKNTRHNLMEESTHIDEWSECGTTSISNGRKFERDQVFTAVTGPLGRLTESTGDDTQRVYLSASNIASGVRYRYEFKVKADPDSNGTRYAVIRFSETGTNAFDFSTGDWSNSLASDTLSRGIDDLGHGIYRLWIEVAVAADTSLIPWVGIANHSSGALSYVGDGQSGFFVGDVFMYRADLAMDGLPVRTYGTAVLPEIIPQSYENKGIRIESGARNNLLENSQDLTGYENGSATFGVTYQKRGLIFHPCVPDDGSGSTSTTTPGWDLVYTEADTDQKVMSFYADVSGGIDRIIARRSSGDTEPTQAFNYEFSTQSFLTNDAAAEVVYLGDDIYFFYFTFDVTAVAPGTGYYVGAGSSADTDGVRSYAIAAPMIQTGSLPCEYIPTTGDAAVQPGESIDIPAGIAPYNATGLSFAMEGEINFADEGVSFQEYFFRWHEDGDNRIFCALHTNGSKEGSPVFRQEESGIIEDIVAADDALTPGLNTPFKIASYHTDTTMNGAVNGTLLTASDTAVDIPDLTTTEVEIALTFNGTIKSFFMWDESIGDAGIIDTP